MEKPIFSVLTLNINNYDYFFDLDKSIINPNAEYIYITNDKSLTSNTWTMKYVDFSENDDIWDFCYDVRFNPFNYVNSDIVLRIDASVKLSKDVTPLIDKFNDGNYDAGVMIHGERASLFDEYMAWVKLRNYPIEQALKSLGFLCNEGYDVFNYKGLYAETVVLQRRNKMTYDWNRMTQTFLKFLSIDGNKIDRLNQTIFSFVLNKYFSDKKILPLSQDMLRVGNVFEWFAHTNFGSLYKINPTIVCEPYLFNKKCELYSI